MLHQIGYFHGEVTGHEGNGEEEDAQFGKEGCAPAQASSGLRVLLGREAEVL
ncbi:hypothetical protein CH063_00621 [Colletotrichum higginsianum]|uniref:Uncharacterized protein n=1 Tax=Colletotrichum higginsianum (strain IMI 349063) TaxID=759273 RepID=H1W217_COLHI|nr:hypothetical protein CH063_00621 [Colletotrichum higginsianum]